MAAMTGARQHGAVRRDRVVFLRSHLSSALPVASVAIAAAAASLWRLLSWPPAATVDAWAYTAWGQAIARAERPLFELGATTPKPLAALLGAIVVPLPPERAFAVVVALAAAALVAGLFVAGHRQGGPIAAAGAVVAFALGARISVSVAYAHIDVLVAALVVAGVALRGPGRIGAFVAAGLLRPEAWVLAALAGFTETRGSLARRGLTALAAGGAAPVLWILADLALIGDPLGTLHWQSERHAERTLGNVPWSEVPGDIWSAVTSRGGTALVVAGLLGLALHYGLARRRGSADPVPLLTALVWLLLLALETRLGVQLRARYALPAVAILALGCGLLLALVTPRRLQVASMWPAAVVAIAGVLFATVQTDLGRSGPREVARNEALADSRSTVESVLLCGPLAATSATAERGLIPQLAASSRTPLSRFGIYPGTEPVAGVLELHRLQPGAARGLPPWPRVRTPLGPLAVAPRCRAVE